MLYQFNYLTRLLSDSFFFFWLFNDIYTLLTILQAQTQNYDLCRSLNKYFDCFFLLLIFTWVTFLTKAAYRRESLSVLMVPERSLGSIMAGAAWQQVAHTRARAESRGQKAHIWKCKQEVERANWESCNTFEAHPRRHTAFSKITPSKVTQTAWPNEDQVFKHPNLRGRPPPVHHSVLVLLWRCQSWTLE